MSAIDGGTPVVESKLAGEVTDLTKRALEQRIRQQEILSELGVIALQGASTDKLLAETAMLVAKGLETEFCKVLEYLPEESCFLVRAGVGWRPDVVGIAKVGADLASPAGYALKTGKPVISNHLGNEQRFRTPELLARHGILRAMNVILQGDGRPFGVLEADSRSANDFSEHDIAFLQGAANLLGMALERERFQRNLQSALDRHQVLLKEMNHRVKNSLAIVSSLLQLQARDNGSPELTGQLEEAALRVKAVARAHDRLYQTNDIEHLDIGRYIEQVTGDVEESVAQCNIEIEAQHGILIETDRAISLALMVNELITNAAKHAYADQPGGRVWVRVATAEKTLLVSVRDVGVGLPVDFELKNAKSLGMRIIAAFLQQLNAQLTINQQSRGTEFLVAVPLQNKAQP